MQDRKGVLSNVARTTYSHASVLQENQAMRPEGDKTAGCGLQYLLLWPLYGDDAAAPYICGAVPLIATVRYLAVGLGLLKDTGLLLSTSVSTLVEALDVILQGK